jgi:TolB-like protein/tetratricopeptide (TPR) repeat protein
MARRLAAIMFTDMVESTQLAQKDERSALGLIDEQEKLARPVLVTHHGRWVKSTGDGFLAEFPSALDAVECAVDLQRRVHEHNAREGAHPLRMRLGIHLGDVQRRGADIMGDAVNIASRVEPLADPGGICLSEPVFVQVRNKVPYQLERLGSRSLKGVREPIDIYRVALPWAVEEMPPGGPTPLRLAILPLTNMSPDPTDEYFADGLTEELISTISKIRDLSVISRTSVMEYKAHPKRVAEIARELNVGTLLEGSVRRAGNRVRIAVQLVDPVADKHLWAENYDRNLEDVFSIQSEIAQKVASALEVQLHGEDKERIGRVPTEVTEAHLLYMKGRFHYQHLSKEELLTALWYFEQAIQKDPRYALAHAFVAGTYGWLGWFEMMPWSEVVPKAEAAARKALELDPTLAEAHSAFAAALLHSWDFKGVLREDQRALELNPSLSETRVRVASWYSFTRRFEDAQAEAQKALELDPLSSQTIRGAADVYLYSGHPERAAKLYEKVMEMDPINSFALDNLGLSYVRLGKYDEGIARIRKAIELERGTDPAMLADLAYALANAGQTEEARRIASDLVAYHRDHGAGASAVALAFASVGDRELAFRWLERAYREHSIGIIGIAASFPFEKLREDPRFEKMLRKIGIPVDLEGGRGQRRGSR